MTTVASTYMYSPQVLCYSLDSLGKYYLIKIIYTRLSVEVRCTAPSAGYRGEYQEVPATLSTS